MPFSQQYHLLVYGLYTFFNFGLSLFPYSNPFPTHCLWNSSSCLHHAATQDPGHGTKNLWCFLLLLLNMSLLLFLVQRFLGIWELVVSTSWVVWSQWDSSLFLDFCTINHGEINKVLWVVFSSFIITCLNIVQVYTIPMSNSSQVPIIHSSQVPILHSSQVHPISWMELSSWTAPYLDVLFTPPVCKTYTFH